MNKNLPVKLSTTETKALSEVAASLGVDPLKLYYLIYNESSWNPKASNPDPDSTARGLIGFVNKTAARLGYANSAELVRMNPTRLQQLRVVHKYLDLYRPFPNDQALFMAVFYPTYQYVSPLKKFPPEVPAGNKGIYTPFDYMNRVYKKMGVTTAMPVMIVGAIVAFLFFVF